MSEYIIELSDIKSIEPVVISASELVNKADDKYNDDVIVKWTKPFNPGVPEVFHSEIGFIINGRLWFFSSTSREYYGGKNGTRWIKAKELLGHPERWLLDQKHYNPAIIREMIKRANNIVGLPYDWTGVKGFGSIIDLTKLRIKIARALNPEMTADWQALKAWYCSRACDFVENDEIRRISPMRRKKFIMEDPGYRPTTAQSLVNVYGCEL